MNCIVIDKDAVSEGWLFVWAPSRAPSTHRMVQYEAGKAMCMTIAI